MRGEISFIFQVEVHNINIKTGKMVISAKWAVKVTHVAFG